MTRPKGRSNKSNSSPLSVRLSIRLSTKELELLHRGAEFHSTVYPDSPTLSLSKWIRMVLHSEAQTTCERAASIIDSEAHDNDQT